jgi:hypothetical protein
MPGRTGNNIYINLVEMVKTPLSTPHAVQLIATNHQGNNDTPGYEWTLRHTWQSWRNRYKHHATRLDQISEDYRIKQGIQPGNKGQYAFVHNKRKLGASTESASDSEKQPTKVEGSLRKKV